MRSKTLAALILFLCVACVSDDTPPDKSELRLARLISDGVVLQRDTEVPIWGWSAPGAKVRVTLAGEDYTVRATGDGAWEALLPPRSAGGPFELTVTSGGEQIEVDDILFGDVWLCSGQSNMEWPVSESNDAEAEMAAADDPNIRHFKVPRSWAEQPQDELAGGVWERAAPENAGDFTAVGYFFARELRRHVDVPIGLINSSWGGSRIEPWMSAAALGLDEDGIRELLEGERDYERRIKETLSTRLGELPLEDGGLVDGEALWADPDLDDENWDEIELPGLWEELGFEGLDGIVWFRTAFELTEEAAAAGVVLGLGAIDDSDTAWVNGHQVGGMERAWSVPRRYEVPSSALQPGRNVIAVRVEDTGGGGGIYGDPEWLYVEALGERQSLGRTWKLRVGAVVVDLEWSKNQVATMLYNRMIHPLLGSPIRGVLWYQGESNAGGEDALIYREHFAGLITAWRAAWDQGDFPFLFVQLANFLPTGEEPDDSSWALLRESQSEALALPNTAQAIAIDIGDPLDVHPRNKQDVGLRLSLAARQLAYGEDLIYSGPVYRDHEIVDGRVTLSFDHVGSGLSVRDGGELVGFAVAGADRRFVAAEAVMRGDQVVVSSSEVPNPISVRYAWGDSPTANLENHEGLPAAPFRTDDWPLASP